VRKCPYCDFNSHTAGNAAPVERYVDALLADLDEEAARAGRRTLETIFLGGGTPSLFPPAEIGRLLDGIAARLELSPDAEITMEANPGTVECGSPAGYRAAGVTRMSIGAQSFDDDALRRLGRIHSSDDIRRAVGEVRKAGFDNFNIDLMHGLPGQTAGSACRDVRAAIGLEPTHISWYQLTLEPNTVFHARPPADLPDEEMVWEIQDAGGELLTSSGFAQYEVLPCRGRWRARQDFGPNRRNALSQTGQPPAVHAGNGSGRECRRYGGAVRARSCLRIHVECAAIERRFRRVRFL
jgi:oxygen-independent coproporphyrinogen-3 oxidase